MSLHGLVILVILALRALAADGATERHHPADACAPVTTGDPCDPDPGDDGDADDDRGLPTSSNWREPVLATAGNVTPSTVVLRPQHAPGALFRPPRALAA